MVPSGVFLQFRAVGALKVGKAQVCPVLNAKDRQVGIQRYSVH